MSEVSEDNLPVRRLCEILDKHMDDMSSEAREDLGDLLVIIKNKEENWVFDLEVRCKVWLQTTLDRWMKKEEIKLEQYDIEMLKIAQYLLGDKI